MKLARLADAVMVALEDTEPSIEEVENGREELLVTREGNGTRGVLKEVVDAATEELKARDEGISRDLVGMSIEDMSLAELADCDDELGMTDGEV